MISLPSWHRRRARNTRNKAPKSWRGNGRSRARTGRSATRREPSVRNGLDSSRPARDVALPAFTGPDTLWGLTIWTYEPPGPRTYWGQPHYGPGTAAEIDAHLRRYIVRVYNCCSRRKRSSLPPSTTRRSPSSTSLLRSAASPPPNCDCRCGSTTWTATTNAVKDKWIGFAGGLRE